VKETDGGGGGGSGAAIVAGLLGVFVTVLVGLVFYDGVFQIFAQCLQDVSVACNVGLSCEKGHFEGTVFVDQISKYQLTCVFQRTYLCVVCVDYGGC